MIDFYAGKGIDASQAFNNFHIRSSRVTKFMASLPKRTADEKVIKASHPLPGQDELLKDFDKLSKEFEAEGMFKPSIPHVIFRVLEVIAFYVVGAWMVRNNMIILGILSMAMGQGRCGWLMHEGGHYSMTGNITIDKTLQICIYGLGCGMSASWWRSQHNRHHSMPQKLGYDVDLNTLPLVAFTEKVVKKAGMPQKMWIKLQAILFPVITTSLVASGWQFFLHPRHILRKKEHLEAACLVARYAIWTAVFTLPMGLAQSVAIYLVYNWFAANYIFINFALSHTHLDVVDKDDKVVDWVRYAAIYTMNVHPGPFKFVNWWMSYLNFQVEHHLFPCMPQFRHPHISARVKAFFEKHGLKYDQRSYLEALMVTFGNLHKVG
ncbi:acyl-CoA desaturase, partial [archaeon]